MVVPPAEKAQPRRRSPTPRAPHVPRSAAQAKSCAWLLRRMSTRELQGHAGCVNRLCWAADGSLLASGSDDQTVRLWRYPSGDSAGVVPTPHENNIFGVRFVNELDTLFTGAADGNAFFVGADGGAVLLSCRCHADRVKQVDVDPGGSPHLGFSASEDGTVRQWDRRERPCPCGGSGRGCAPPLVTMTGSGAAAPPPRTAQERLFALMRGERLGGVAALNPADPHLLATVGESPFVALFDRRMARRDDDGRSVPVLQLRPPVLRAGAHGTHVAWSARGDAVVANYNSDFAYAFDVSRARRWDPATPLFADAAPAPGSRPVRGPPAAAAERHKAQGNAFFAEERFTDAVALYSRAIASAGPGRVPATYYSNRAQALLQRGFVGDAVEAALDCERAIAVDAELAKAHYRRAVALSRVPPCAAAARAQAAEFARRWPAQAARLERSMAPLSDGVELTAETRAAVRAPRLVQRFVGAWNANTDIKEASFFGNDFVVAGADSGHLHLWRRATGGHEGVVEGVDSHILNCVQEHPFDPVLAASGIDSTVKLLSPCGEALGSPSAEFAMLDRQLRHSRRGADWGSGSGSSSGSGLGSGSGSSSESGSESDSDGDHPFAQMPANMTEEQLWELLRQMGQ